jgi:hypothetical protein
MTAEDRKVSSLRELPRSLEPPRDLWPQIEARISAESAAQSAPRPKARALPPRWLAAAALVAAVAVGMWIGRSLLPGAARPGGADSAQRSAPVAATFDAPATLDAAYVSDPRYARQRAALVKSLEAQLAALPPPARAKVLASLTAIRQAKEDLQQALGRDPGNALLQELLVNTYQDEMRVLTDVREASDAGRGI